VAKPASFATIETILAAAAKRLRATREPCRT
jgi:hypothetical protein